jgi:ribosomal protein S18 acetylase RimI-like enzyme
VNDIIISTSNEIDLESRDFVWNELYRYNIQYSPLNQKDFTVHAKLDNHIVGVAMGESKFDWMILQYLAVKNEYRGLGLGKKLLKEVIELAMNRKCNGIHLDTFEFQAKNFYAKFGFVVYGEIEDHPSGYKRYFMKLQLASSL